MMLISLFFGGAQLVLSSNFLHLNSSQGQKDERQGSCHEYVSLDLQCEQYFSQSCELISVFRPTVNGCFFWTCDPEVKTVSLLPSVKDPECVCESE